jgi:hypothetical protein
MEDDLIKYTVIKGFYKSSSKIDIYLPKTLHLVYKDGDIGNYCHTGHNHYIGFIKYNEELFEELQDKNSDADIYKFDDLILIIIDNIFDEDNILPIYTSQEMMSEFNLDNYFIVHKKPNLYTLKTNTDLLEPEWTQIQTKHTYQIIRIKEITGPYSALGFRICIESDLPPTSDKPYYMMEEWLIDDLVRECFSYNTKLNVSIHKDYWDEYNKLRDLVLSKL